MRFSKYATATSVRLNLDDRIKNNRSLNDKKHIGILKAKNDGLDINKDYLAPMDYPSLPLDTTYFIDQKFRKKEIDTSKEKYLTDTNEIGKQTNQFVAMSFML